MMKATMKIVGTPAEKDIGTFRNYQLRFASDMAFTIVQFQPHYIDAREVVSRVELKGKNIFSAKDHINGRGEMVFLREIDDVWMVYRLIGMPRNPHVNAVWTISSEGVTYPGVEQAISLKQAIAAEEDCEVALTMSERVYQLHCEQVAAEAKAAKLKQEQEAAAAERAAQEEDRRKARALRDAHKQRLRSSGNTRSFITAGGKPWNGFVVASDDEAMMLEEGDRAVFLDEFGQVARVVIAHKSRSGRLSFDEISLGSASVSSLVPRDISRQETALKLTQFGTFRRPYGKRKEGEPDVVAYYVTAEQFAHLRTNRPNQPMTVVVEEDGRLHLFTVRTDGINDLGFFQKVVSDRSSASRGRAPQFGGRSYKTS